MHASRTVTMMLVSIALPEALFISDCGSDKTSAAPTTGAPENAGWNPPVGIAGGEAKAGRG